ncbi:MAG: hypothetical protein WCL04_01210 [Verrucomicrobiota bacterium]
MTKKELTSLLIAFLGGWLIVEMLVSLIKVATTTAGGVFEALLGRHDFSILLGIGLALIPFVAYGLLGWLIIRCSNLFADILLRHAKLNKDDKIEGIGLAGLAPLLFSMLGLYFIISYTPLFVIAAGHWFVLEAQSSSQSGNFAERIRECQEDMYYNFLVLALAFFVFRRPDYFDRLVQQPQKKARQSSGPSSPTQGNVP